MEMNSVDMWTYRKKIVSKEFFSYGLWEKRNIEDNKKMDWSNDTLWGCKGPPELICGFDSDVM